MAKRPLMLFLSALGFRFYVGGLISPKVTSMQRYCEQDHRHVMHDNQGVCR